MRLKSNLIPSFLYSRGNYSARFTPHIGRFLTFMHLLVYMRELSRPRPVCHLSLLHLPRSYKRDLVIINLGRIQYNIVRVEYRSINSRLVYRARQIETGREYQGEVKDNFEEHGTNPRGSIEYLMSIAIETEMVQIRSKEERESICGPWYRGFFSVCVRARD